MKNATGRAGSATVQARALFGKDGFTDLEVTTGTIGEPGAPGNISKLQIKGFDVRDSLVSTVNYNNLKSGGSASYRYERFGRGDEMQIQANVTGIDRNRTGVVTLRETVKFRPDLSPTTLTVPAEAKVNTLVNVTALVNELNGDVGAFANCVLSVNGSPVDNAEGIWVNAGGAVTCAFSHLFTEVGTQALTVTVEAVNPGDFDTGNNSVEGSIRILDPTVAMNGSAWVNDRNFSYTYRYYYSDWYWYDYYDYLDTQNGRTQEIGLNAYAGPGDGILQGSGATLDARLLVNGAEVNSLAGSFAWSWNDPSYGRCGAVYQNGAWAEVCSYNNSGTHLTYRHDAGDVTYYGWYYNYYYWYGWYGYSWSYNNTWGEMLNLSAGDDVSFDIEVNGDGPAFTAQASVPLVSHSSSFNYGDGCYYGWYYTYCYSNYGSENGVRGSTMF